MFLLSIEFVRLRTIRYFQSFSIHSYFSNIGKYLRFEENTKKVVTDTRFPVKHFLKISKVCNLLKSKLKCKSLRAAAGLQVITLLLSHYVVDFWRKFNENCILYDSIWYSYATAPLNRCLLVFYSLFVPTAHVPSADVVQATRSRFIKLN